MIIKEAVNNRVKYANAANIELQITFEKGKPVIEMRDNATGYNHFHFMYTVSSYL